MARQIPSFLQNQTVKDPLESLLAPVSQTIANVPNTIMAYQEMKDKRKKEKIDTSLKMAEQKLKMYEMGQGRTILKDGIQQTVPGITGIKLVQNEDGTYDVIQGDDFTSGSKGVTVVKGEKVQKPEKLVFIDPRNDKMTIDGKEITSDEYSDLSEKYNMRRAYKQLSETERQQQRAGAAIVTPGEAGRVALAFQSGKQKLPISKSILFPDGTPESFDSATAFKARLPFLGGSMPKDEKAQRLYRNMADSLSAKILIQTGVAARPEEVNAEFQKFFPNLFSDPVSTMEGMQQLSDFYGTFLDLIETKKMPTEISKRFEDKKEDKTTVPKVGESFMGGTVTSIREK